MMLFKTDENLPVEVSEILKSAGHDSLRADEQGLAGFTDPAVAAVCMAERRALLTLDLDFSDVRRYRPENFAGIVILRPKRQSIPRFVELAKRMIPLLDSEPLIGKLWIVDDSRVRIRPDDQE